MDVYGPFNVQCELCGQSVMAVDVRPRRDRQAEPRWEGEALICPRCDWKIDQDPKLLAVDGLQDGPASRSTHGLQLKAGKKLPNMRFHQ